MGLGLRARNNVTNTYHDIPLKELKVQGYINHLTSTFVYKQVYANQSDQHLEVSYQFLNNPLSVVSAFKVTFADEVITGIVKLNEEARADYTRAREEGKQVALLQKRGAVKDHDLMSCEVGNLKPGEQCTVELTILTQLTINDSGNIEVLIPKMDNLVAPATTMFLLPPQKKMMAANGRFTTTTTTDQKRNIFSCDFNLSVTTPQSPSKIRSTTHSLVIEKCDANMREWNVTFGDEPQIALAKETAITIILTNPFGAQLCFEQDEEKKSSAFQLSINLAPEEMDSVLQKINHRSDFQFLVDTSASMSGDPLKHTQECLRFFMNALPLGCVFNIRQFNSRSNVLFEGGSQPYNDRTMEQARRYIDGLFADSSTVLLDPLRLMLNTAPYPEYNRQIILLTDGDVADVDAVVHLCKQHAHTTRIFTLGLGTAVSRSLIERIAQATNTVPTFVPDGGSLLIERASDHLEQMFQPAMVGLSIEWHRSNDGEKKMGATTTTTTTLPMVTTGSISPLFGTALSPPGGIEITSVAVKQSPKLAPHIYPGKVAVIYGLVDDPELFSNNTEMKIVVTAKYSNGRSLRKVFKTGDHHENNNDDASVSPGDIGTNTVTKGNVIHKLAAKARINELKQLLDLGFVPDKDHIKPETIYLAQKYQIVSDWTSFIAVSSNTHVGLTIGSHQYQVHSTPIVSSSSPNYECAVTFADFNNMGPQIRGGGRGFSFGGVGAASCTSSSSAPLSVPNQIPAVMGAHALSLPSSGQAMTAGENSGWGAGCALLMPPDIGNNRTRPKRARVAGDGANRSTPRSATPTSSSSSWDRFSAYQPSCSSTMASGSNTSSSAPTHTPVPTLSSSSTLGGFGASCSTAYPSSSPPMTSGSNVHSFGSSGGFAFGGTQEVFISPAVVATTRIKTKDAILASFKHNGSWSATLLDLMSNHKKQTMINTFLSWFKNYMDKFTAARGILVLPSAFGKFLSMAHWADAGPDEIMDVNHAAHVLVRTVSPYMSRSGGPYYKCDVCEQDDNKETEVYHCELCGFDSHPDCLHAVQFMTTVFALGFLTNRGLDKKTMDFKFIKSKAFAYLNRCFKKYLEMDSVNEINVHDFVELFAQAPLFGSLVD